jgi:formate/nitrite transporter
VDVQSGRTGGRNPPPYCPRNLQRGGAWEELVSFLVYPIGFIAVIIGRAQLFTENTLYPVVLVLANGALSPQRLQNSPAVGCHVQLERGRSILFRVAGNQIRGPGSGSRDAVGEPWHCHILEHEEHDMMRPLVVL